MQFQGKHTRIYETESRGVTMENNIFNVDWHYKKYYLGYISNSPASMDLFFYSHEQRYIVKVRSSKGKINTVIEAVEEFKLTQKQGESFCINVDYQNPSALQEMYYRDLPEDLLEDLIDLVQFTFPDPTHWKHIDDVVLFDAETEMVVPFLSEKSEEYEYGGIDQKVIGVLINGPHGKLATYPERMVSQLQGKPFEDMYKLYPAFKDKKVVLLGASYLNVNSRNYYKHANLHFLVENTLYTLHTKVGTNYELYKASSIDKLLSAVGSDKEEFYFYGKEVEVAEYYLLNCTSQKFNELWTMGNKKDDLWIPEFVYSYDHTDYTFASDGMFAVSIEEGAKFAVRVMTSKMEQIKGSSYNVKRKHFLQKVASFVEV